jgi:hypothetical protein
MGQNYRFQLLAPSHSRTNSSVGRTKVDDVTYRKHLSSMQKLRGRVYLKDGAIQPWELDEDGHFEMRGDDRSWHFILLDDSDQAIGCARYLLHSNTISYDRLRVSQSFLARSAEWAAKVRHAVESDLRTARSEGFSYVEIGGWALAEEWRNTKAALEILVASYALAGLWGGCLGSCTATVRHGSSSILRRIGGASMGVDGCTLPPYEDPQYGCFMELLKFDSRFPEPRFLPLINQLRTQLSTATAIRATGVQDWKKVPELSARPFAGLRLSPAGFY